MAPVVEIGAAAVALLLVVLMGAIALLLVRQRALGIELDRTRREAAESSQAKSEFLAMMSHEIRTPINAVIGMSTLLAASPLAPAQRHHLRILEDSAAHLLTVINDILDYSRLEARRFDVEIGPFDLKEVVESTVEIARGLPGATRLDIAAVLSANIPRVLLGDSGRLSQIFINLLGNAVKYTNRGCVTVSAAVLRRTNETVLLRASVSDTGAGISPEHRERLFQPFEQGDLDPARRKGGTGLGLAICRHIVDAMGGCIGVDSRTGHGSTFWFEVELEVSSLERAPIAEQSIHRMLGPCSILVAEDTPANQIVARVMLEKMGHRVQVVSDGREAVAAAGIGSFDVILMDVQMPVMDGYEAARLIRALPGKAGQTPIVALTAFAQPADRQRAVAAGMTCHASKPIRASDLATTIERAIGSSARVLASSSSEALDPDILAEFEQSVGKDSLVRLLRRFGDDAKTSLDDLRSASAAGDGIRVRGAAHRLSGLYGQFGATRAAEVAMKVESAGDAELADSAGLLMRYGREAVAALNDRLTRLECVDPSTSGSER